MNAPSYGGSQYMKSPNDGSTVLKSPCHRRAFWSTADGFGDPEQRRLRDAALRWQKLGASVMLSNADTPFIRSLYPESAFAVYPVSAPRPINGNGNGRGPVAELLITAYA